MWFVKEKKERIEQDGYTVAVKRIHFFITRGDSAYPTIDAKDGSGQIIDPAELGTVRIHVRDAAADEGQLLFKGEVLQINGQTIWHIRPEDTRGVECKAYVYDVQVELSNGDIFTIIPLSDFVVMPESTLTEQEG